MTEKLVLPKAGLPKKWQKFQNMILLPSERNFEEEDLERIKTHYKVSRIAQQQIIMVRKEEIQNIIQVLFQGR